jgi:hypothetical protein
MKFSAASRADVSQAPAVTLFWAVCIGMANQHSLQIKRDTSLEKKSVKAARK